MARSRFRTVSVPLYTSPIAPWPILATMRYLPMRSMAPAPDGRALSDDTVLYGMRKDEEQRPRPAERSARSHSRGSGPLPRSEPRYDRRAGPPLDPAGDARYDARRRDRTGGEGPRDA